MFLTPSPGLAKNCKTVDLCTACFNKRSENKQHKHTHDIKPFVECVILQLRTLCACDCCRLTRFASASSGCRPDDDGSDDDAPEDELLPAVQAATAAKGVHVNMRASCLCLPRS